MLIETQEGKGGGRQVVTNTFQMFFLWRYPQAEDLNKLQFDGSGDSIL